MSDATIIFTDEWMNMAEILNVREQGELIDHEKASQ